MNAPTISGISTRRFPSADDREALSRRAPWTYPIVRGQTFGSGLLRRLWWSMGIGRAEFVALMLGGAVPDFYESLRWPGYSTLTEEVRALSYSYTVAR